MDTNAVELRTTLAAQTVNRTISVSLPASAYFDLDQFQKVQQDVLGQLGCPACTSGYDIRYDYHRNFVVTANLSVAALEVPQALRTP